MEKETPRIKGVKVAAPFSVFISWDSKRPVDQVNLAGWIATGGDILAPLKDPEKFRGGYVAHHGRAVAWDDDDLSIDSMHLRMLADEQRPFGNIDVREWQDRVKISNAEAADLIGVSLSTWNSFRASAKVPPAVAIALRAAERDPLLMQAHLRPRTAGRPRKTASDGRG